MNKEHKRLARNYLCDQGVLTDEIVRLIQLTAWDLFSGPIGPVDDDGAPWPGFSRSCDVIREALSGLEFWISEWGDCTTAEPDWGEIDPESDPMNPIYVTYPEDWGHYSGRDAKILIVGKDLAEYV